MQAILLYNVSQIEEIEMERVFDGCVALLVFLAGRLGIFCKESNVWIFVVLRPALTLDLSGFIMKARLIRRQDAGEAG